MIATASAPLPREIGKSYPQESRFYLIMSRRVE